MNFNCPCCGYPQFPVGTTRRENFFGDVLVDMEVGRTCKRCDSTFYALFKGNKKDSEYNKVFFYNIEHSDKILNNPDLMS